jgi:hypothetical protein
MSGQTREILALSALAVIVALGLGLGLYFAQPIISSTRTSSIETVMSYSSSSSTKLTSSTISSTTTSPTSSTTTSSSMKSYSGPCASEYSSTIGVGQMAVFATNSSGVVCVTVYYNMYITNPNYTNPNATWTGPPVLSMLKNSAWTSQSENLTVKMQPSNINVFPGDNETIVFEIAPLGGTHAIYDLSLPSPCWTSYNFVLAVGYSTASLQGMQSSIPNPYTLQEGCNFYGYYSNITGITNIIPVFTS